MKMIHWFISPVAAQGMGAGSPLRRRTAGLRLSAYIGAIHCISSGVAPHQLRQCLSSAEDRCTDASFTSKFDFLLILAHRGITCMNHVTTTGARWALCIMRVTVPGVLWCPLTYRAGVK